MEKPIDVRVKKYKNGYAVEILYGFVWKNLLAELYFLPEKYYFDTEKEANSISSKIKKMI